MSKVKIKLDKTAVRTQILQSKEMLEMVTQQAQSQCDAESHVKAFIGFDRAKAIIYPDTKEHPE